MCGDVERTNKHAGERQLDKHKCESADCEGVLCGMMMGSGRKKKWTTTTSRILAHVSSTLSRSISFFPHHLLSAFPLATSSYAIARAFICVCAGKTMKQAAGNMVRVSRFGSEFHVLAGACCCFVAFFRVTFTDRKRKLNA